MTTQMSPVPRTEDVRGQALRAAAVGAGAGVVGSLLMATYAMVASLTYQHHGFFTPIYHIASVFLAPKALMSSMQQAMNGHDFFFSLGPALLGAVIHMMIGLMYGAVFGAAVGLLRLPRALLLPAGAAFGVLVFVVSSWVGLPLAAAIFSSGDQIAHMASRVGYPTFLLEHVLFGAGTALALLAGSTGARSSGRTR